MSRIALPLVLALAACSAAAADPAAPEAAAPDVPVIAVGDEPAPLPPEAVRLDDIIVTATKRPEAQRDLPGSVAALRGQALEDVGASRMQDFLKFVPGVTQTEIQPDLYRITIRGVQSDTSTSTPQTAGIYIDDMPMSDPFLTQVTPDLPPFDLQSVEVLKGPQGTLFGGSGLAGMIRYRLADAQPGLGELRTSSTFRRVTDGEPAIANGAAANVPFGAGAAALRLVAVTEDRGGTIDDLRNGVRDTDDMDLFSGRALLRWHPVGDLSIGLKALRHRVRADDVPLAETTDGRLERERALRNSPYRTEYGVYGLDLRYALPWADVISATTKVHKLGDLAVAYAERILGVEDAGQPIGAPFYSDIDGLVQEIRLQSPDEAQGPWQWLVGGFAHRYASYTTQNIHSEAILTGQQVSLLALVADVAAREYAVFGEVTRALGERWRVTAGLRGYQVETWGTAVSTGAVVLAMGQLENRNEASLEARGVSPKIAVQYEVSPAVGVYAGASRGFRFGGIQTIGPSPNTPDVPTTYAPDSLWSYEAGLRTRWLEDTLWADVAAFYLDWQDPQIRTTTGGAFPLNIVDNVGAARSAGAELALSYVIPVGGGLNSRLSAAYTDARTTEEYTAPNGTLVAPGARLPCTSDVQAVASLAYPWSIGGIDFDLSIAHAYFGPGANDIPQTMTIYDYQTTDVSLGAGTRQLPGAPRLTLGVINAADERGIVAAFVDGPDNFTTVYNRTRTLELRLELRF